MLFKKLTLWPLWYGIALLLIFTISWGSLARASEVPTLSLPYSDKLVHFTTYLCLAAWLGFICQKKAFPYVFLFVASMGLAIEILQPIISNRFFEWGDLVANTLGQAIGLTLAQTLLFKFPEKLEIFLKVNRPGL